MTSRRALCAAALALVGSLAFPSIVRSQSATISVHYNGGPVCSIPGSPGQFFIVDIRLVRTAGPVKSLRFRLVPSCQAEIFTSLNYDLVLDDCITDGGYIGTIIGIIPATCDGSFGQFYFDIEPLVGDAKIQLTDCDGYPMVGIDAFRFVDGPPCDFRNAIAPYRPTPADGATDVPTNTLFEYVGPANAIELSTEPLLGWGDLEQLICHAASACGGFPTRPTCSYPIDPGQLLPNTTYYWRASTIYPEHWWCDAVQSEVFTFTTGDRPLATTETTWGRIKTLYRD